MFVAMNRFKVLKDRTEDFENVWLSRQSHLHEVPGFRAFHLLKGPEREDHVLYASHTIWASYAAFENWTKSEAFRKAHARAGDNKPTTLGHPEFEGFQAIQEVTADGTTRRLAAE
jgi:heme-degrading monooxygenase HmoA